MEAGTMGGVGRVEGGVRVRSRDPEDVGEQGTVTVSCGDYVRVRWDWSGEEIWVPARHIEVVR
jgi:hypothetical protein